jgi:transposase
MWPFRTPPADPQPDAQDRLARLFAHAPQRKQAYDLREQLTTIFDTARANAEGLRRIHRWRRGGEASGLTGVDPFRKLLDTWLELMAHDCRQRPTSGVVEGLNKKLTGLKRRGVGISHLRQLFQRLTLELDGDRRFRPWPGAHHSIWARPRQVQESQLSLLSNAHAQRRGRHPH